MTMTADPAPPRRRLADTPISGPSAVVVPPVSQEGLDIDDAAVDDPVAVDWHVDDPGIEPMDLVPPPTVDDPLSAFLGPEWAEPDAAAILIAGPPIRPVPSLAAALLPELEAPAPEAGTDAAPEADGPPPPVGLYPDDIPVIEAVVTVDEEDEEPAVVEASREALAALALEAAESVANGWRDPNAPEDNPLGITLDELREILVTPIGTTAAESAQKRRRSMVPWIVAAVVVAIVVGVVGTWFAIKLHGV